MTDWLEPNEEDRVFLYKGVFYPIHSAELKALLLVEGTKPENKETLLGLIAQDAIDDDNLIDKN